MLLLEGRDVLEQRLDRSRGRTHSEIQVALDVGIRSGVDPRRYLLGVRAVEGDFNDAGVLDRLHLNQPSKLSDRIGARLENRMIVEVGAIPHPLGDVAAVEDLVLWVDVTYFDLIPLGSCTHPRHVS